MRKSYRLGLVISIILLCVVCDQVSKALVDRWLASSEPVSWLNDSVHFERSQNDGAILGLGASLPQSLRLFLAVALNGATLLIALSLAFDPQSLTGLQISGIALLAGGGVSNLIDRLYNDGAVFDFVRLGWGWARTGIFNLADVAIVVGVLMVLVFGFTSSPDEAKD